jgi:Ni/Co efflux regulator RcnB
MRRMLAIAICALAMPTLAIAAEDKDKAHRPAARVAPRTSAPAHVGGQTRTGQFHTAPAHTGPVHAAPVHTGPIHTTGPIHAVPVHGPVGVGVRAPWMFHGRSFAWHPVRYPRPWVYPHGYGYRLWAVGAVLPAVFWSSPTYYYTDYDAMGLPPPDPGFQYVEYGPDLLLVNVATGEIVQVFPGAFS